MQRSTFLVCLLLLLCGMGLFVTAFEISGTNVSIRTDTKKKSVKLGAKYRINQKIIELSVTCRLSDSKALKSPEITWRRLIDPVNSTLMTNDYIKVSATESDEGRTYESVLTVKSTEKNTNFTAYKCIGKSDNKTIETDVAFHSVPLLYITVSSDKKYTNISSWVLVKQPDLVIEHKVPLNITCHASGYPPGTPKWSREDSYDNQIDCGENCKEAMLMFSSASYENDRSQYTCTADNKFGSSELKIYLRVKNPKAYLVPAILLSVITALLSAIYIVSELVFNRRREVDATDDENSDESADDTEQDIKA